ncbi:MAG: glycosyltransferase family 9 protein [Bacteroidota bacterium]|nr:glycosyltransferase family 9 protein [Bacteroidota bacterium]
MSNFLIIQTAYIGDVVLATSVLEKLHHSYPGAKLDIVVRKGNESLFVDHPFIRNCFVWDKKKHKYRNLFALINELNNLSYDYIINLQRFFSSGFITFRTHGNTKIGFKKNPLSFLFNQSFDHVIGTEKNPVHEIERNHRLIAHITDNHVSKPRLYPSEKDFDRISGYTKSKYICIAPASVWFTKQFPADKWVELIERLKDRYNIFLIGGPADYEFAENIASRVKSTAVENLCGKLTLLQSAALMNRAVMNFVNDSAPLHFASAVNAPVTAIFCSTMPYFGFGPLSDNSKIVEISEKLDCRPCGIHGRNACPKGHFKCANDIKIEQLLFTENDINQ